MTNANGAAAGLGAPPRRVPAPLPTIHPVPEYATEGELAARDAPLAEIRPVTELFHHLLPELVVNVAFFRAQLQGSS
jgi:hypothetical protein